MDEEELRAEYKEAVKKVNQDFECPDHIKINVLLNLAENFDKQIKELRQMAQNQKGN